MDVGGFHLSNRTTVLELEGVRSAVALFLSTDRIALSLALLETYYGTFY